MQWQQQNQSSQSWRTRPAVHPYTGQWQPPTSQPPAQGYNSSTAPCWHNNTQGIPMDISCNQAPNCGRGFSSFQGRQQQQPWGRYQGNVASVPTTNNSCFQCGAQGHFTCNCPQCCPRQPRANLINFDKYTKDSFSQGLTEGSYKPSDPRASKIAHLYTKLIGLTDQEKLEMAKQMGVDEGFSTA